jgi:hypothetical protein
MGVQRDLGAGGKTGQTGRHILGSGLFSDQWNGLNPIAPFNHRQRFYSQNVRFRHKYLLSEELVAKRSLATAPEVGQRLISPPAFALISGALHVELDPGAMLT